MVSEKTKKYIWSVIGGAGVIFFWIGVWDGIGSLPYVVEYYNSLILGIIMLIIAGLKFKWFSFSKKSKTIEDAIHHIKKHPQKEEFKISYFDKIKKGMIHLEGKFVKKVEKGMVVLEKDGKEIFIPLHRVNEVKHKGKSYWKA